MKLYHNSMFLATYIHWVKIVVEIVEEKSSDWMVNGYLQSAFAIFRVEKLHKIGF